MSNEAPVCVWDFPRDDFEQWRVFTDNLEFNNYHEYLDMHYSLISSFEAAGHEIIKICLTVEQMAARLEAAGLDNTTENRATILTMEYNGDDEETTN
tara:strand:+ start:483 stop:773 length:291 start_codon:yes stop_codon:yes gene_type:complete